MRKSIVKFVRNNQLMHNQINEAWLLVINYDVKCSQVFPY